MSEYEVDYEDDVVCPNCGKTHRVKGTTWVDLEPPDRDEDC